MKREKPELVSVPDIASEPGAEAGRVVAMEKWLLARMLEVCGGPPITLVLWDGQELTPAGATPVGRVLIRDRAMLYRLVVNPDLEFGEGYSSGRIDVDGDLPEVLVAIYRALSGAGSGRLKDRVLERIYRPRRNTLHQSRHNIHHHYDIGNGFYRLWLDRQLVYTCAYFPSPGRSLEDAQTAKLDYVCRKLRLEPGETVAEAGCGWGALALHMARHYGVNVRAYNISKEQLAFARERAKAEGLADRVEFVEGDYREISGQYDAFVSVGMLEHVGVAHYQQLGETINRCLKRDGRGLIHSIGRDRPALMNAWIEKRIFPGACPPSLGEMTNIFEPWRFSVLDVENLRLHYARTLEHWYARYQAAEEQVGEMFDEEFVRTWRLYLAGSLAAFINGDLQLFQVVFARSGSARVPWTRDYLYEEQ
ncbi:MAG: cyclopropane-fatty-acyl-phospholipid synthase family protein [Gammaproteobacteria bacterium]